MRVSVRVSAAVLSILGTGCLTALAIIAKQGPTVQGNVSFSRDVLPLLADRCFKCHGPDAGSRMADLRLDVAEVAFARRGDRYAIVPGKPQNSLVVDRISHKEMPPPESGKSLSKQEIALITRWIAEGATYSKLWSYEPLPNYVPVPNVNNKWPNNNIDRFILDRLNRQGLRPSPSAPRERWLRRVTLDLTGLPPTEGEIASFQSDSGNEAYERVVDRLLASTHFGERVAVDWLDAARYSDSYGYQSDLLMPAWPYRDWVIRAFNNNLPYNEFLVDQLAGDLLESPTRDQRLATAFNRLHRQSNEGGSIAAEFKMEYAVDRLDTFGTAVLGQTLGCARCHDHKFDPITQREFYQLYGYFNSIEEYGLLLSTEIVPTPSLLLPTPAQEAQHKELLSKDARAVQDLKESITGASARYELWLAGKPTIMPRVTAHFSLDSYDKDKFADDVGKATGVKLGVVEEVDGKKGKALLFDGDNGIALRGLPARERWDAYTWSFWISDPRQIAPIVLLHRTGGTDVGFCGFDLTLENGYLTARVMRHWPGNAVAVRTRSQVPKDIWTHIAWSWDGSGRADGLKLYIGGKPAATTVLANRIWKRINAYGDLGPSGGEWSFAQRFRDAGFRGGKLDEITFANTALSPLEIAQLYGDDAPNGMPEFYVAAVDERARAAQASVQRAQEDLANFEESIYEISVMEEAQTAIPAYLLARGQYDAPKTDPVERGVPKSMPALPKVAANDRLTLARWATQRNHPLTARVAVNRLWQMVFGVGLVETSENFGMQGTRPTHPELLDYLARRFVDSGWDVKLLLREMVLSATYRQDSIPTAKHRKVDPLNRLYARGPSQRLSAEMVRDLTLAASGLLDRRIGGPPVNPYQPAGIWQENNTMSPGFVQSKGADLYRRSIYSTVKRTTPVPSMLIFDGGSREACTVRRASTNTPLQALVLLNDVQFVEAARALAELVMKRNVSDPERIRVVYVRLAGRGPDEREMALVLQGFREQRIQFGSDPDAARKLIAVGEARADPSLNPVDLAAMTVAVQTVLNSDAVIWKR